MPAVHFAALFSGKPRSMSISIVFSLRQCFMLIPVVHAVVVFSMKQKLLLIALVLSMALLLESRVSC